VDSSAEQIITANNRLGRKVPNMTVDGIDESDILAMAPPLVCDRVHWSTLEEFDAKRVLPDLPMQAYSREWSDGQHRIWVPEGRGYEARELIKEWCVANEIEALNMRVEPGVPFRDVDSIPGDLMQRLLLEIVDWLHPRIHAVRRRIVIDFDLLQDEDLRPMMYLFVSDHIDRFDADRIGKNGTLNLASFMLGKIRKWPQDAARAVYGRNLVDDQMHLSQAIDESMATVFRRPTEAELASRMKTSVADLRKREQSVAEFTGMRFHDVIVTGGGFDEEGGVDAPSDTDVEADATSFAVDATLTRAILDAARARGSGRSSQGSDPLGLAAVYLSFWGEMSRQEVATALNILPKTAGSASQRIINEISASGSLQADR
jgi:hypothetical protein